MSAPAGGWPVVLEHGDVRLRPLRRGDRRDWKTLRRANADWLAPWDATAPDAGTPVRGYRAMVRDLNRQAARGAALPFALEYRRSLVGQVTVGAIVWGSMRSGQVGYWVDRGHAGRGIVPTAVALVVDHCLLRWGMHRLEVNIRPENTASLRVVEKLGFRDEGLRRRYLHIAGDWRDHRTFALTGEELRPGLVARMASFGDDA